MVDALKVDLVEIEYAVKPCENTQDGMESDAAMTVKQVGKVSFRGQDRVVCDLVCHDSEPHPRRTPSDPPACNPLCAIKLTTSP